MNEKNDVIQIIGSLMKKPSLLSQTDKYSLSISDFSTNFERYLFDCIEGLYYNGANKISAIDIENSLSSNAVALKIFEQNKGHEYLEDAEEFAEVENFDYYYGHLKKINALKDLEKIGVATEDFYCPDLTKPNATEINKKFERLTVSEIFDEAKRKILKVERKYTSDSISETKNAYEGIEDIINAAYVGADIGLPVQGKLLNMVMGGARRSTFAIRSGASGLGKTRGMVADACFLAFPFRFNTSTCLWEQKGSAEKVLFIATEQSADEIQKMILAYLTGINESKFRYGQFTELEENIIKQALVVLKTYQENFLITKMASPTNELLKNFIREKCILEGITHVFFDYISISPSLIQEFKGLSLRNDELLLILSTTLKDIASELDVFVMSATQVNASADQNKDIRNEASLAGGRSTINKADYGFIMARPTAEELDVLEPVSAKFGVVPNVVTDVYKVRAGEWTQVRIWSYFDLGILRKEDLFMTDSRLNVVDLSNSYVFDYENWESEEYMKMLDELNKGMVV